MAESKKESSSLRNSIPRPIFEDEVLVSTTKGWYIGTRRLTKEEVSALREDARHFQDSFMWSVLRKDIHFLAYLRATNKAQSVKDIEYANAMYQNLEIIEKFLKRCTEL